MRLASLIIIFSCAGCVGPWRPSPEHLPPQPNGAKPTLAACLRADRLGERVYERRELPLREDVPATSYVRRNMPERLSEGFLAGQSILPLERYLEPAAGPPAAGPRPRVSFGELLTIFFELSEPGEPIPADLEPNKPITTTVGLSYYDYTGRLAAKGTLTRRVEIEGLEDVDCPAGRFEDCPRLRVDLSAYFPWVFVMDLTTFVWYTPQVGEVRRVQHMSGWFLIFWFGSACEYRLVSAVPPAQSAPAALPPPPLRWHRGLVVFDRGYPHPQIGGMVIDLAATAPAP